MFELIPQELKEQNTWVNARADSKIPMQSRIFKAASCSNPDTWSDFATAKAMVESKRYDYLGFVFTGNGYIGIDIDKGFDGVFLSQLSIDIMTLCKSYTEKSRSGRGIHIIIKGDLPFNGRNNNDGVEIYKTGRYFITTGKKLVYDSIVEDKDGKIIETIIAKYFPETEKENPLYKNTIYTPSFEERTDSRISLIPKYPPILEGGRNTSLHSLAGQLLNAGCTIEKIREELLKVNQQACKPPLPLSEINAIVTSISRYRRWG